MSEQPWIDGAPPSDALRLARRGLLLAVLPLVSMGGCIVAAVARARNDLLIILMWIVVASWVLSIVGGVIGWTARRREKSRTAAWAMILGFGLPVLQLVAGALFLPFTRGRALRRGGRVRLPETKATSGWAADPIELEVESSIREQVARAWRAMAATETASIASFSSYSNQLLALGAPSELIEGAHRDALDEIRHARLCYAVATGIDGEVVGAAEFPAAVLPLDRTPTIESLAIECARESCVLEGASALAAHRLAALARPELRPTLSQIADDEARHAAHGWEALEWLLPQLDSRARERVVDEVRVLGNAIPESLVPHDDLEEYGIAGPSIWNQAVREAVEAFMQRLASARRAA